MKSTRLAPLLLLCILLTACSTGPTPPAKGTPAFGWLAAQENMKTGDYVKTLDHLELVAKTDNEYAAKARPWQLVLLAGTAEGYMEVADYYEYGARANKANPAPFRKQVSDLRSLASRRALQFAESFERYEKGFSAAEQIPVFFGTLRGSALQPPALTKVGSGILLAEAEFDALQRAALDRGILLAAGRALGTGDDAAKTREVLKGENAQVPRATFLMGMAETLVKLADLFSPMKLDLPDRRQYFLTHALEAVEGLPDSKELKEFRKKTEAELKKIKTRK